MSLLLILALGQVDGGSADAGVPPSDAPIVVLDVVSGELIIREETDGVVTSVPRGVGDGCYLPTESCVRVGKQKARKDAELEEANRQQMKWIAVAFGGGAVVGVVLTVIGFMVSGHVK